MSRSLKVRPNFIQKVKNAVRRKGYPRQKDLAEEVGMSLATVSNYLNGKPVDCLNFQELSDRLSQDWREIALFEKESSPAENSPNGKVDPEVVIVDFSQDEEDFIYVERPPIEAFCYEALQQPGSLIRIKAPSLMGKTSLMRRTLARVAQHGYRTVYLNLHLADRQDFTHIDRFLKWFCAIASQSLGLPNQLSDYWDEKFSTSKVDCTDYFEKYLLAQADSPLVLYLDEVDRVFPHNEVAAEFLGLLRAWYEQAKIRPVWKKLRLVVAHSTEVYVPLNINESPFNVGLPVELPELTSEQVLDLACSHGWDWTPSQIDKLMALVGGHPYLVEQAFSHLKVFGKGSLEDFWKDAATEAGIYRNHLQHLWRLVQKEQELVKALEKVVRTTDPVRLKSKETYKLYGMGLVKRQGNHVTLRCHLYRQFFCDCFGAN